MGFMDKAKKMAEQAQAKIDEVQKNFNEGQQSGQQGGGDAVQYDKHGRPVNAPEAAAPAAEPAAPPTPMPEDATASAPTEQEPAKVQGDPLLDEERKPPTPPPAPPSGGAPGMTSGDPLG